MAIRAPDGANKTLANLSGFLQWPCTIASHYMAKGIVDLLETSFQKSVFSSCEKCKWQVAKRLTGCGGCVE